MNELLESKTYLINKFSEFEKSLNGEKSSFIHKQRLAALDNFKGLEFPLTNNEEWKYTNLTPIFRNDFNPNTTSKEISKQLINDLFVGKFDCNKAVFVNGFFDRRLSDIQNDPNIEIINLAELYKKDNKDLINEIEIHGNKEIFIELNNLFTKDGLYIKVKEGKIIERPIYILYITSAKDDKYLVQPRNIIHLGKNSQANIVEHYYSFDDSVYFNNEINNIILEENAIIDFVKLQEEGKSAFHISNTVINQKANSVFTGHLISLGASIARNNISTIFKGENAECTFNGLYLLDNEQVCDIHSVIDHAVPCCNSYEHFKGILDDKSKGIFNGKIIVRRNAQKTNAFQKNNNIILSDNAWVDTKPQLEIFADDVKCSHGATIGQLDEEALFYLNSRGIGHEAAKIILIHAFASEVFKSIKESVVKDYLEEILTKKFNA